MLILSGRARARTYDLLDITARMRLEDGGVWIRLNLHLRLLPRPTATITNAPLEAECLAQPGGWVGANVAVAGTLSPVAALGVWNLSGRASSDYATGATATLQIGPQRSTDRAAVLTFSAYDGELAEWATRDVRIVDHQAPVITSTDVAPSCGWGYAAAEQDPKHPALCAGIPGIFSDVCSSSVAQIFAVRVYDYSTGVLVDTRTFQYGSSCVTPHADYLDANMAMADYEIDWRARDEWGNLSPMRHWRGWFSPQPPSTNCTSPTLAHKIFDN